MSHIKINLNNIVSTNDFIVSYKKGESLGNTNTGFIRYPNDTTIFNGGTTEIILSGITLIYGEQYWIKIEEYNTERTDNSFVIENIRIHNEEYFEYYCPTPDPIIVPDIPPVFEDPTLLLNWVYSDSSYGEDPYEPYETTYWNLNLSRPLTTGESISLTIEYNLLNHVIYTLEQRSLYSLSEGVASGNIIGIGNVDKNAIITTYYDTETGTTIYTLTESSQTLRLGLSCSFSGTEESTGTTSANINFSAIGNNVNVAVYGTNPSVSVSINEI